MTDLQLLIYALGFFACGGLFTLMIVKNMNARANKKASENKKQKFEQILNNIKNGNSKFKTRVNKVVYIETILDNSPVELVIQLDINKVSIFNKGGTICLYTQDGLDEEFINDIYIYVYNKYVIDINNVVNVMGMTFHKNDFEKMFGVKYDDISKAGTSFIVEMNKSENSSPNNNNDTTPNNNNDTTNDKELNDLSIDYILDKINKVGIEKLTKRELEFLDNYSKR